MKQLCGYFGVSRQSFYKQQQKCQEQSLQQELIIKMVQEIRGRHPRMGGKKLYKLLDEKMHAIHVAMGRDKFFDLLREHGLLVTRRRKYAVTTQSYHRFRKYENKLKGFIATAAHQAWVCDITYVRLRDGFVYLFLITDLYSRKIIGWNLSRNLGIESAIKAQQMAIKQCHHTKDIIHHSDRGFQYCAPAYTALLTGKDVQIQISMAESGNCYENATAERVNGILKEEYLLDGTFNNYDIAQAATNQAVQAYNEERPHWALDLKTPACVHRAA